MTSEQENSLWRVALILLLVLVAVLLAVGGVNAIITRNDDLPMCVAGQDEICASPQWLRAYRKINDISQALNAAVPGGYVYNGSGKFIRIKPPAPPTPPPQPTPTPTPEKDKKK